MKKTIFIAIALFSVISLAAQNIFTVTFTCRTTDNRYVKPDYIKIENLDREWTETIHFPDTVFQPTIYQVVTGIKDFEFLGKFDPIVSPNPFNGTTTVTCDLLSTGEVTVEVTDLTGRPIAAKRMEVQQPDRYIFHITLSRPDIYLMNIHQSGKTATTKLVNTGSGGSNNIEIDGTATGNQEAGQRKSSSKSNTFHPFRIGDQMRYVAYASDNPSHDTILFQYESDTLTLVFDPFIELGDSLPCPGTPTVTDYDGNIYNTVKIGYQCWMKENLRTTHYADGTEIPLGDELASFSEPLYFDHPIDSLTFEKRGYLYNWISVMNGYYSSMGNPSGVQGICPNGWHVPSVSEWEELINYVSSQNEYTCSNGYGNYIGKALAAQTNWPESPYSCSVGHFPLTNNATGFSALSAGYCLGSTFDNSGAFFSSCSISIIDDLVFAFSLSYHSIMLNYSPLGRNIGLSVRCLRD